MATPSLAAWTRVDEYLAGVLLAPDDVLEGTLRSQHESGLPAIEVAPLAGRLLTLIARMSGARRILEIGTLAGYSTICLARALPASGTLTSIEAESSHAELARRNVAAAGLSDQVDILVGRGDQVLPSLVGTEPFDLVFIDADKESNTAYLDWAARLGRPGTVVIVDNIGRDGEVADESSRDPMVQGTRAALQMLGEDPRFDATAVQTVGIKGWDGVSIAMLVE